MRKLSASSSLSYDVNTAPVRTLWLWAAISAGILLAGIGCKATSYFTRNHYSKPSIESTAGALAAIRESSDPALRRAAFEYLGDPRHLGTDDRDEVSTILGLAFSSEPQAQSRIVILQSLARLGSPKRWEPITMALKDKDPAVRIIACRLIGTSDSAEVTQLLDELLVKDSNLDVRLAAANALGNIPTRDAAMVLLSGVADADVAVRYRCRESLRHIIGKDHAGSVEEWRNEIQTANFEELAARKRIFGLTW